MHHALDATILSCIGFRFALAFTHSFSLCPTRALVRLQPAVLRQVLYPARLSPGGCSLVAPSPVCPVSAQRWSRPVFGPLTWATAVVPVGFENISAALGIRTASSAVLSPAERADLALFSDVGSAKKFASNACRGGPCGSSYAEQSVYHMYNSSVDVILYRGAGMLHENCNQSDGKWADCVLLAASRDTSEARNLWSNTTRTNIPDAGSNLNAGSLSDGRIFLTWNGVRRIRVLDADPACYTYKGAMPNRNPLTLAISSDGGFRFDKAFALVNITRPKRFCGREKCLGASYPQTREVQREGTALDGLWTVYSVNKEDIQVTFVPAHILNISSEAGL
eukprot:SAG31_NODE_49_length_30599_cov_15.615016_38_plen_336_part_00